MRMRYWMNRLALVLLALPTLGILISMFAGRGVPLRAGPGSMQGPMYGLLMTTGTWLVAWSQIRRQEARARAAQRPTGAAQEHLTS